MCSLLAPQKDCPTLQPFLVTCEPWWERGQVGEWRTGRGRSLLFSSCSGAESTTNSVSGTRSVRGRATPALVDRKGTLGSTLFPYLGKALQSPAVFCALKGAPPPASWAWLSTHTSYPRHGRRQGPGFQLSGPSGSLRDGSPLGTCRVP